MSFNTRAMLERFANLLAIVVVVGFLSAGYLSSGTGNTTVAPKANAPLSTRAVPDAVEMALPETAHVDHARQLGKSKGKGKGKGKGSVEGCIPLYPTPAPTKGSRRQLGMMMKKSAKGSTSTPVRLPHSHLLRLSP